MLQYFVTAPVFSMQFEAKNGGLQGKVLSLTATIEYNVVFTAVSGIRQTFCYWQLGVSLVRQHGST